MAWVRDEVGQVSALRQVAGKRRCGVESDDHGAGFQLFGDARGNLADMRVRNGQNDDVNAVKGSVYINGRKAEVVLQTRLADIADFDMTDVESANP
jgi:hypothetical protein